MRHGSTRTHYNAIESSLRRPWISGTIEGRFRAAHSPLEILHFDDLSNRPPIDTISNIYVNWGTIEDDVISQKNIICFLASREITKNALYFLSTKTKIQKLKQHFV